MPGVEERQPMILTAKKQALFCSLQRLYNLSKKVNDAAHRKIFEILYRSLEETRQKLLETVEMESDKNLEVDEKFVPNFAIYQTIDDIYCNIKKLQISCELIHPPGSMCLS
ncbi:unnamed protein product [Psylliodes chrysocephalus]|uniref:Uncharacterized protein n=1 Tax=Psylliodes chrysocephalus TaxID=3402493 RepID=A0A9P0CTQ8_9CUCU|nr:unnamed protein product [Psylliodes chrysocephala]